MGASTGTGDGTITYQVQANPGNEERPGSLQVAGGSATLTVTQAPPAPASSAPAPSQACNPMLDLASQSVQVDGGSFNTQLILAGACFGAWNAMSNVPWITNVSPSSATLAGTIDYTVAANPGRERSGLIDVTMSGARVQLTVTQAAGPCAHTLTPNTNAVPAAGGSFSTMLAQTGGCSSWTAVSDVPWITGVSPSSGTEGATIAYTVQAHTGATERIGHITVTGGGGNPVLTVTQVPPPCNRTLTPNTSTVPAAGGDSFTLLAQTGACSGSWTAVSNVPWITDISTRAPARRAQRLRSPCKPIPGQSAPGISR